MAFQDVELRRNIFIGHGEEELFGCEGNIFVAFNAAQDKFPFIGLENITPVGKFL